MLHIRWLGRVRYRDAHALQHGLSDLGDRNHLLLLEHPSVYTLGVRADPAHVLVDPATVGAELVTAEAPPKVVISEYLDVAQAFFPEGNEVRFVNAVLDHMAREARPEAF